MARAVRTILDLRDDGKMRGILGTISEMCLPKDSANEEALATAVGGGMNSIIVESDQIAHECMSHLRQKDAGRATFLPLNKISIGRSSGRSLMVERKEGVIGFAWQMLDYDPRIETAVKYVLRDTLIVDSMATARKHMGGVRMVTLNGGVTEHGGAMVGGSRVRLKVGFGGCVQGMNEVDKLDVEVGRLHGLSYKVNDQLLACKRKQQELNQRISKISGDENSLRQRQWKEDLRICEQRLAKATGAVKTLDKKLIELEKQAGKKADEMQRVTDALRATELAREVATAALQEASPAHLQEKLREVQEIRVGAFAAQAQANAGLLTDVSNTVDTFMTDLREHDASDNVTLLLFSEFGRRVTDNGSGTDHGAAGVAFAVGEHVKGGVYGTYPSLAPADQEEGGNLKFNLDFRSVYSTILEDWFQLDAEPIVGGNFERAKFLA